MNEPIPADVKARLAELGQNLDPDAVIRTLPPLPPGTGKVLVLDRVVGGTLPDYCTHGYASCAFCGFMCWIGHATSEMLLAGQDIQPICMTCAAAMVPPGTKPEVRLHDHRRADGPHE